MTSLSNTLPGPESARGWRSVSGKTALRDAALSRSHHLTVIAFLSLLALGLAVIGGLIYFAARGHDRIAAEKSAILTRALLTALQNDVGRATLDYAWWTDAYDNLAVKPDATWADQMIGQEVHNNFDIDGSFVVDEQGHTVFAFIGGKAVVFDLLHHAAGGLDQLIAKARASSPAAPTFDGGLISIDGVLQAAAVSTLVPDPPPAVPPPIKSVLVFTNPIDQAELDDLARLFDLPRMSFLGTCTGNLTCL